MLNQIDRVLNQLGVSKIDITELNSPALGIDVKHQHFRLTITEEGVNTQLRYKQYINGSGRISAYLGMHCIDAWLS